MADRNMDKQSNEMLVGLRLKNDNCSTQNDENTMVIILSSFESWQNAKSNWINIKAFNKPLTKRPIISTNRQEHLYGSVTFANELNSQQSLDSDCGRKLNGIWVSHLLLVHERLCEECYTHGSDKPKQNANCYSLDAEKISVSKNFPVSINKTKTTGKCSKGTQTPKLTLNLTETEPNFMQKKILQNSKIKDSDDINTRKNFSKAKSTISRTIRTRSLAKNSESKKIKIKEQVNQPPLDDSSHGLFDENTENEEDGCEMDPSASLSESDFDEASKTNSTRRYEFKCKLCEKSFNRPGTLKIHVDTHHGGKKFICEICKKEYTLASSLKNHMLVHTEDPKECSDCGKKFPSSISMKNHLKTHSPRDDTWKCDQCGKNFFSKHTLKNHLVVHLDERNFCCDICGKSFKRNDHLMNHRVIHTGEKVYSCDICGCTFNHSTLVYKHKKKKHGERDQLCNVCGKAFFTVELLNRHTRTHSAEPHFKCRECGKGYRSESGFKAHMNTHTGIVASTQVQRPRKQIPITDRDKNKQAVVSSPSCVYGSELSNVRETKKDSAIIQPPYSFPPCLPYEYEAYRYF